MLKYTLDELKKKIIKLIKKYVKTTKHEDKLIIQLLNYQYRLKYNFWSNLLKNKTILNATINNILVGKTIIKTLDYYFQNMTGKNNEVKEKAILEYVAIAYRTIQPRLPQLGITITI